jgi:hypothetical protein
VVSAPGKGKEKQVRVVIDDDEVASDEDVPLYKWLLLSSTIGGSSGSALAVADVAAVMKAAADKEATDKRVVEEAAGKVVVDKEAANKRAAEEATVNVVADREAADKRAAEEAATKEAAVGATGDSSAPGQVPSSAESAKRAAVLSSSAPSAKRPYRSVWNPRFV